MRGRSASTSCACLRRSGRLSSDHPANPGRPARRLRQSGLAAATAIPAAGSRERCAASDSLRDSSAARGLGERSVLTPLPGDRLGGLAPLGEDPDDLAHATAAAGVERRDGPRVNRLAARRAAPLTEGLRHFGHSSSHARRSGSPFGNSRCAGFARQRLARDAVARVSVAPGFAIPAMRSDRRREQRCAKALNAGMRSASVNSARRCRSQASRTGRSRAGTCPSRRRRAG